MADGNRDDEQPNEQPGAAQSIEALRNELNRMKLKMDTAAKGNNSRNISTISTLLHPFYGDPIDAQAKLSYFLQTAENLGTQHGVELADLPNICRSKFKGKALEYLSLCGDMQTTNDWTAFKKMLKDRYDRRLPASAIMTELTTASQRHKENAHDFGRRLEAISKSLYKPNNPGNNEMVDELTLSAFIKGLNKQRIREILHIQKQESLAKAIDLASTMETNLEVDQASHRTYQQ